MNIQDQLQEIVDELISLLQHEVKNKNSIIVSPEFVEKWNSFDAKIYTKHLQKITDIPLPLNDIKDHDLQINTKNTKNEIQQKLNLISQEVAQCTKCPIHEGRTHSVFGTGNPQAELVFVGEAPGAEEDRQGLPFVGRAGQLLTDIIVKGMKMRREDVYICNVLKCRPPNNRDPNPIEVMNCEPYLLRQLEIIRPKVICALGRISAQTLLKTNASINELRGKWHNYHGIPLRVTYHPAYLLRNPADKKKAWIDIQEVMKLLNGEITVTFENEKNSLL